MLSKAEIKQIRQFNRHYTQVLGVLNKQIFGTDLSWPEGRILIEIGLNHLTSPMQVAERLQLDRSYTSRTINRLAKKGLIEKLPSPTDGRAWHLRLTAAGQATFDAVNQKSDEQITDLLAPLTPAEQAEVFQSITTLAALLFKHERK